MSREVLLALLAVISLVAAIFFLRTPLQPISPSNILQQEVQELVDAESRRARFADSTLSREEMGLGFIWGKLAG